MKFTNKNIKKALVIFISAIIILYLIIVAFVLEENYIDNLNVSQKDSVIAFFKIITRFGDWYTILAIVIASFILKNKNYFKYIVLNTVMLVALNQILKFAFQRPRPSLNILNATGYSFPSGHAMVNAGFYGFIIFLVISSNIKKIYKILLSIVLSVLIILIGISRIYLGAHYITDVIAGMCFSVIYLVIYVDLVKIGEIRL